MSDDPTPRPSPSGPDPRREPPVTPAAPPADERNWAMLAHITALALFFGIPPFVGPLVVWLLKKDAMPFVEDQAKEALNFQISMTIYGIVAALLVLVVVGFLLLGVLLILELVFVIMAAVAASRGERFRYPITIRLIR